MFLPAKMLFFFVHPSKFHVFRDTITQLRQNGHIVDIVITSKDVLEDLLVSQGWEYTNIFPEGRKLKGISPLISSAINFFRTIYRLHKFVKKKKYDLFITDDLLVYLSKWFKTPSFVFTDDDLAVTKLFSIILARADYVIAPMITDLGKFNSKKIGFEGYKELAYLYPGRFIPDIEIIKKFNGGAERYFLIRLVSLRAYHDVGMKGLTDKNVIRLITLLEKYGKVYISSERSLPDKLEKYRLKIEPRNILHVIYFADIFIGDSQTMTSEAAVLGTPSIRINNFVGKISVMEEKQSKYGLSFNFRVEQFDEMLNKLSELLVLDNLKNEFDTRKKVMLSEKIDLSGFMTWLFDQYPESITEFRKNPNIQNRFK